MEESTSIRLVSQFLHDHGFQNTLEALQKERCFAEWCIHVNKRIKFGVATDVGVKFFIYV